MAGERVSARTRLSVRVTPRASRTELAGFEGETLRVRLQAPPVDGAANDALRAFLAGILGLPKSAVSIERGGTSRTKRVSVTGMDSERVAALLEGAIA